MKPVLVMLLVASVLGGCAMPEPIPLQPDIGIRQPVGDGIGLGVDATSDASIHLDRPQKVDAPASPAAVEGGPDGVKGDGLKGDGLKLDGLLDRGTMEGGKKKDVWSNKPKG